MRYYSLLISIVVLVLFLFGFNNNSPLKQKEKDTISGMPNYTLLNINNISTWIKSDGSTGNTPMSDPGAFFPRSTGNVLYLDGLVWGGIVKDGQSPELRVGGSTYRTGLQPGAILGIRTGNAEDPNAPDVRIWRVRNDWETADLSDEAKEREWALSDQQIRDQYQTDWNEWPANKGAPYQDLNNNGQYDKESDIPGIPGADQTVWFVANDLNSSLTMNLAGSAPIGLEMQITLWAYDRPTGDPFGDIIFKHARLIYKGRAITSSDAKIQDMSLSMWSDPDIGNYKDDFTGCDSVLELGYAYNGSPKDDIFENYDLYPPAFGYLFMYGPIIPSTGDTAVFNFSQLPGYRNQKASSFVYFASGSVDSDPTLGYYEGTIQWYNLMQGLRPQAGTPWVDPLTGHGTAFPLGGDPLAGEGWIDGISLPAGDRRMGLTTGPFTMALGDTQEVACALIGDISSSLSTAYVNNISGLKRKSRNIRDLIKNGVALNIQGTSLARLNTIVNLTMYYLIFDKAESVVSSSWVLTDKPATSNAVLGATSGATTNFIPDISGLYYLTATITTGGGDTHTADIIVEGTDNQDAIGQISLDKSEIIWGDSIMADGSGSYDPDGDDLEYSWFAEESGIALYDMNRKANIYPWVTGDHEVMLTLFDGYFETNTKKNFMVHPRIEDITIEYSFIDTAWTRNLLYFHGDTLLVPIWRLDSLFIYNISDEKIEKTNSIYFPDKQQIFNFKDNLLYVGSVGESGFFGPGKLYIYEVGENWALTPVLEGYAPDFYDISVMKFYDNGTLVQDVSRNLYRIDFKTNPAHPNVLAQANYMQTGIYNLIKYDTNILGRIRSEYRKYHIVVLNENTLSVVDTLDFPLNHSSFSIDNELLFLTFRDSTLIYNISDISKPARLSRITTISPVSWLSPGENGSYYHSNASYIGNSLIVIHTTAGFCIYYINDPHNPLFVASYYCGMRGQGGGPTLRHVNGNYYATGQWDLVVQDNDIYSGINRINLVKIPQQINSPGITNIPKNYELYQNYPNPFNPVTTIEYYLPKKEEVSIIIYNVIGQKVTTILDKKQNAAKHTVSWDGTDLYGNPVSSGIYFYRLKTKDFEQTRKMLLIR